MKTTLDLDDDLVVRAKEAAAREGSTLTALIEEGLRLRLNPRLRSRRPTAAPRLAVYRGRGGLLPGIDPTSNRSLYDAADDA